MKRTTVFLLVLLALLVEINTQHLKLSLPPLNLKPTGALAASLNQAQALASSYIVTGAPSITAGFINQVLANYHSPAAETGQALYDLGVKYDIDPVYALAFFWHESDFGRAGIARITRSLGNLRCIPDSPCVNGYASFSSWEQGYEAWYKLIRDLYINQWGLKTVAQIVPTYAPAADHNAPMAYIAAIEQAVTAWRAGKVQVEQ
jgi:hypothetical protein